MSGAKNGAVDRKQGSRALLDAIDITILNKLLAHPDTRSIELARNLRKPLSTIQRRRARLEGTILRKDYSINTNIPGWRSGEFFAKVENGRTHAVAKQIFDKYSNLTMVTTTVNHVGNLVAHIYFKDSPEMFSILEEIKRLPDVSDATYAEHICKIGERKPAFILDDLRK